MTCSCGKYHYSTAHYFKIHGDYLPEKNNYRVQVPFKPNGKPFDQKKYQDHKPYPLLTYKWCCKYCGRVNPSADAKSHKADCDYIAYVNYRRTA